MNEDDILGALRARRDDPATRVGRGSSGGATPGLYAAATPEAVREAEGALGFPLPRFLARVLSEVGNGGFGPGFGLVGLAGGHEAYGESLAELYVHWRSDGWKKRILPVLDWGCAIWSCVDLDDNVITSAGGRCTLTRFTLPAFLAAWAEDVDLSAELFETEQRTIINPFTRRPMSIKSQGRAKGQPMGDGFEPR